jgi:pyruvate formate lyase activating enzyme
MNGTIFDIKRFAIHDGPGIRTTVFFKGCPLNCWWCHNPEGIKDELETICIKSKRGNSSKIAKEKTEKFGRVLSEVDLMEEISKDQIFYDQSGGGVTFSGGEPLMQMDFLMALLACCRQNGIHTALDTSGYASAESFEQIYDMVDIFLYDLKLMDNDAHIKYIGVENNLILENLEMLSQRGNKVIIRIPMIPGITDTEANLDAICEFISPLNNLHEVSLLPYNMFGEHKMSKFDITAKLGPFRTQGKEEMQQKARLFESQGYRVKVGG